MTWFNRGAKKVWIGVWRVKENEVSGDVACRRDEFIDAVPALRRAPQFSPDIHTTAFNALELGRARFGLILLEFEFDIKGILPEPRVVRAERLRDRGSALRIYRYYRRVRSYWLPADSSKQRTMGNNL